MKTFLIFISLSLILLIGGNKKPTWFRCKWCGIHFDDFGNTQREAPAAEIAESVDRCQDCREQAEKELNGLREI